MRFLCKKSPQPFPQKVNPLFNRSIIPQALAFINPVSISLIRDYNRIGSWFLVPKDPRN